MMAIMGERLRWDVLEVMEYVCVFVCMEEGVAGGQTGTRSQSWEYNNSNSIELATVCVCAWVCVFVSSWIPDPFGSLFRFK